MDGTEQVVDEWTAPALRTRCEMLRNTLGARGVAAAAIAGHWPTDAESLGQWIRCFAGLTAELRLAEQAKAQRDIDLQAAVTASLDEESRSITLSVPDATKVYPKSFHTLAFLESLDAAMQEMQTIARGLESAEGREVQGKLEVDALAPLARSHAVRTWVWILTSPGVGLPFDDEADALPDPPAWTQQLTPEDLLAVFRAHVDVHRVRLAIIATAFPPEVEAESRLSLAGFLGAAADRQGRKARTLMRKWSLGAVFAQAVVAAQTTKEAYDTARANRGAA